MTPEIDYLKKIYVFQDLTPEETEAVSQILTPCEFEAGATIMKEGEEGKTLYVIASGEVLISKSLTMRFAEDDYRETEKTLSKLKAKDYAVFGEMALITEDKRSATVTAATDCVLYETSREDFLRLAQEHPALGCKVMFRLAEMLSNRLKTTGQDVIRLTTALSIALSQ
jgi:CRP-like cAMP-binding protein